LRDGGDVLEIWGVDDGLGVFEVTGYVPVVNGRGYLIC
jgi:hypothetical protein